MRTVGDRSPAKQRGPGSRSSRSSVRSATPRVLLDRALDLGQTEERGDLSSLVGAVKDEHVRAVLRHRIENEFATLLAVRLDGPDATLRAELVAATLIGVELLRNKIGTRATSGADRETLAFNVERMMATLVQPSP